MAEEAQSSEADKKKQMVAEPTEQFQQNHQDTTPKLDSTPSDESARDFKEPTEQQDGSDLLCHEEMESLEAESSLVVPLSKATAEEVAEAASHLEASLGRNANVNAEQHTRTKAAAAEAQLPTHLQPPSTSNSSADNDSDNPLRAKKRKATEMAQLTEKQRSVVALSRHAMCDWSELGLGESAGSGAWNAALRMQFIQSGSDEPTVPQISPSDCLHRLQQALKLPTIIPPSDSFLISGKTGNDPNSAGSGSNANGENREIDNELRDVYAEMIRQDVSDGSEWRRELRFTSVEELCDRMRRAEKHVALLSEREQKFRVDVSWEMQQEVNRVKGLL